jgi:hypothetical protein
MKAPDCLIVPIVLVAVTWALPVQAQSSAARVQAAAAARVQAAVNGFESTVPHRFEGLPTDWADRFLVYSEPPRYSEAYEGVQSSPRYWLGQIRRASPSKRAVASRSSSSPRIRPRKLLLSLSADWNTTLGTNGTVGAGMFPAKYTFNPIGTANCTNDFVVFNTRLSGLTAVAATQTGNFTKNPNQGQTVTITSGTPVTLTADNTLNTGTNFALEKTITLTAQNLVAAINRNTTVVTATSSAGVVTVTATTPGLSGNSITLSQTTAPDFTWNAAALTGGADGKASIAAFNNLYPGCTGTVPSLRWAYNTADAATTQSVDTSVVLSSDGTQAAFVQATATGAAQLVVLKWHALDGTIILPYNLSTSTAPASYRVCTAPCRTSITFSGSNTNVDISSPFYDYANDVIYVGDNGGVLHKFTGVFNGTPAEVTSGWPITVASGSILTGPVFDYSSKNIFVGDSNGYLYYVRETGSTKGTCGTGSPPCLGTPNLDVSNGSGRKLVDPPMVDSTTGRVFAFTSCSGTTGTCGDGTNRPAQAVQADTSLANVVRVDIGLSNSSDTFNVRAGDFDDPYYTNGTGHMYVCGNPYQSDTRKLYQLTVTSGVLQNPAHANTITLSDTTASECSPATEIYNTSTSTDWIFVSVPNTVSYGNCTTAGTGCIRSFNVTTASNWPSVAVGSLAVNSGTSGIIVDSNQSTSGLTTPNVYFSDLSGGLARQATQSGLN